MGISIRQWKMGGIVCSIFVVFAFLYQNCSKVQVEDISSQVSNNNPLDVPEVPSEFSKVTVGTSELADLKMLFVVDNSYTMKQNNINLATAFQTLFNSQNSDNLSLFPVTSYLLTVGQKIPAASLTDQLRLDALLNWQVPPDQVTPANLSNFRAPSQLGKIAGDSIGFSIKKSGGSFAFEPAAVVGLGADGSIVNSISKSKSESASKLVQDFRDRMTLLQDMNITNYEQNKDILDNESGLCAVARVLRSSSYVKAGDLAVLNVFTDENDADVDGKSCLAGYTYSEGNEDLVDGGCETRRSTFNYKIAVPKAAECVLGYKNTFDWKVAYSQSETRYSISYSKYADTYTCPETKFTYQGLTAAKRKRTKITLTYNAYKMLDGVKVVDQAPKTRDLALVDGYKSSSDCAILAKSNLAAATEVYVSNTCVPLEEAVSSLGSCRLANNVWDPNCIEVSKEARTKTFQGNYTLPGNSCWAQLQYLDGAYIPGSESCSVTGNTISNSIYNQPACVRNINATPTVQSGLSDNLSTQLACDNKAKALGGAVDASHPATCTSSQVNVAKTKTGSLNLKDYASVNVLGECPADVKAAAYSVAGVTDANSPSCTITAIPNRAVTQALASTCAQQADALCAPTSNNRFCVVNGTNAATTVQQAAALTADENLACTAKCSDSQTGFCKPTTEVPSPDPAMSIADYLVEAKKSVVACAVSTVGVTPDISKFNGKKNADMATLCPAKSPGNLPVYVRIDKTYRFKGFAPDYIAGNAMVNGVPQPSVNLPTYIAQRATEVFGGQKPIVNIFIRTADDGLGEAGSRGVAYEQLALTVNAQVHSVLSADYSSALKDLSTVVKSKLLRTFKVPNMASQRKVIGVKWKSQSGVLTLTPQQWVQSGASIEIDSSVALALGDELEFEYQ